MNFPSFNPNTLLASSFLDSQYLNPDYLFQQGSIFLGKITHFTFRGETLNGLYTFFTFFALLCFIVMAYAAIRLLEIRIKEHKFLHHEIAEYAERHNEKEKSLWTGEGEQKNERWAKVLHHLFSTSLSDWKLAIIESDSMLDTLMDQLGFKGENLGEKLKVADRDKFRNLTAAWEVHTIRNKIAHEGLSFEISHHEAKRIIALYEQIFREFGYI